MIRPPHKCSLCWRKGGEKYQEAFYIYEEFGQSGGSEPSLKVLNGQAAANIALGRYPEAESLLLEALNKVCAREKKIVVLRGLY